MVKKSSAVEGKEKSGSKVRGAAENSGKEKKKRVAVKTTVVKDKPGKVEAKAVSALPRKKTPAPRVSKKEKPVETALAAKEELKSALPTPAAPVVEKKVPAEVRKPSREDVKPAPAKPETVTAAKEHSIPPKKEPIEHTKVVEPPKPVETHKTAVMPEPAAAQTQELPQEPVPVEVPREVKILEFDIPITVKDLAVKLGIKPNEIIVKLMAKNIFATINQGLGEDIVQSLLTEYGIEFRKPAKIEDQIAKEHKELEDKQDILHLVLRPPVVTMMGHVDHGKTSLLDFIRKTKVADKEKGGITQHIGAYEVKLKSGSVTFLDTPGHEAFTAMRARGANATDIVVLVVAADDGVMPQTKEALDHARAAGVTIVVALNKCDLPSANLEKVKGQLGQLGLTPEDWGGKTITVPVSAKTGEGVERLLEMLLLEAELLELKANPNLRARGVVIEGRLSSGQGPVATILVKNGTLRVGDMVLTGMHYGRIKAMMDHTGTRITDAPPSKPVSILGLSGVPMAGDEFFVVKDEKKAKTLSVLKQDEARRKRLKSSQRVTLEDFYKQMKDGAVKELNILLKGDVQGSVEAIKKSLFDLGTKDVKVNVIHADVGNINESDIMLAVVSNAVVIGFNVKVDSGAEALAQKEGIDTKIYGIIYEALQDITAAMEGLLEPFLKEVFVGRALVKQVFKVTKAGTIAGCSVVKGKIVRTGTAKLIREKNVVYEGKLVSLKRFKDDAREVNEGFECGIGLDRHDDIKTGDLIEIYAIEKVARRLDTKRP